MSGKKVFLIGPGLIGREIFDRLVAEGYEVTTLVRREAAAAEFEKAGGKVRMGGLDDHDVIVDQTSMSDIVIHTATADHLPSAQAVIDGIEKRAENRESTIYIHNSGSGVHDDNSKSESQSDKVYCDDDAAGIDTIADSAPHRSIDLAILNARKRLGTNAKIVIMMPPVIYGYNEKYGRLSIQMPTLTRFALKQGYAGHLGQGAAVWNQVHVFDLARAYLVILHWLEQTSPKNVLDNPYFFCENGVEFSWKEAAIEIGKALHAAGRLQSPEAKTIPEEEYKYLFGTPASYTVVGSNSRCRTNRLRELGWNPSEKGMFQSLVEDEIPVILKEKGDFQGYGRKAA